MMVWLNAWPMCSVPVTLGGGKLDREIFSAFDQGRRSVAALFPFRAPMGLDVLGLETLRKRVVTRVVTHGVESAEKCVKEAGVGEL
jgi:hypothetical protein